MSSVSMTQVAVLVCALALVPPATFAQKPATTGSINRDDQVNIVIAVKGAPGDGNTMLFTEIRDVLAERGIHPTDRTDAPAYRLNVNVTMGQARNGKQPIILEWVMSDRRGKRIGAVTQFSDLEPGQVDGPWERTAFLAADTAALGIIQLLPQPSQ
jgi:hypothetical protein